MIHFTQLRKTDFSVIKLSLLLLLVTLTVSGFGLNYNIVDTGQTKFFDNTSEITIPQSDNAFWGQDAQFTINTPSYTNNNDGTITDNVTGLMWVQTPDLNDDGVINIDDKLSYLESIEFAGTFEIAGYSDWRLPSIKEMYSLIVFSGLDPSGVEGDDTTVLVPFIDTEYFDFAYGDTSASERVIDAQMASSTIYVGTTMNGDETMFGVNFADGRIKGYPTGAMPGQTEDKQFYIMLVRGDTNYGSNEFVDNSDNTISDEATGLMWDQNDSEEGMNWESALEWVKTKNTESYNGYSDWRLPSVKELQSIVDYTRSPSTTNSAAIDAMFNCSTITDEGNDTNYPFFWSGTTHENMNNGSFGSYVCFGEALGFMSDPMGNTELMDVHGAGAQRSDPKTGDPADYPTGNGPQGDVVRINNYVRLVRNIEPLTSNYDEDSNDYASACSIKILENYPNPFNPTTTIYFEVENEARANPKLVIYNIKGQTVKTFSELRGRNLVVWNGDNMNNKHVASGVYYYSLVSNNSTLTKKMILMK